MFADTVLSFTICVVYSLCALCLGALLLRLVARRIFAAGADHGLAAMPTSFLLGQGLLAAIWQLLALGGLFSPQVVTGVLALSFLAGIRFAIPIAAGFGRLLGGALRGLRNEKPTWLAVYALTGLLMVMTGIATINPPQPRGDALAFYMALPKVVAASHRLLPLPGYEAFAQIGLQGEFHFAALMSLSGGVAAKMFLWPMGLAAAAMLAVISAKVGLGQRGRWIVMATLFTSTAFTNIIWDGKLDLFSAALGLAALAWSLEINSSSNTEAIRLVGLSAGLAIVAKITYLVPLLPGLLLIIIWRILASLGHHPSLGRRFLSTLLPNVFWLGFWMAIPLLINVLKNALLFGQPLAPLFNSADTTNWTAAWFTPGTTAKIILTFPLSLVFGQFWGQSGQMSPLLLAFLPLLFLVPRSTSLRQSKLAQVALAGVIGIASWHLYNPSAFAPRYVMSSLLVLLPLAARGAEHAVDHLWRSRFLSAAVVVALLVALLVGFAGLVNPTKTALLRSTGRVTLCEMEEYGSDASCRIAEMLNQDVAPEERVFLAAYYRYWYRPDIIQCLNSTAEIEEFDSIAGAGLRWTYLLEHGYRYVVIDEITHGDVLEELDLDQVPEGIEVSTVFEVWPFVVFRLEAADASLSPQLVCAQVNPPAWQVISVNEE